MENPVIAQVPGPGISGDLNDKKMATRVQNRIRRAAAPVQYGGLRKKYWSGGSFSNAVNRAANRSDACPIWWQRTMPGFPSDHLLVPRVYYHLFHLGGCC